MLAGFITANLSALSRSWLADLGMPDPDSNDEAAFAPWYHALAVTYSPQYLDDNSDGIAIDWPRIPLPKLKSQLEISFSLGFKVASLLDTENEVNGVTEGTIVDYLRVIGSISSTDLHVTENWGSLDRLGRVNPGRGKVINRDWAEPERATLEAGFSAVGINEAQGFKLLGNAVDIYLNPTTCWRGIPEEVWNYIIGGYPVIKKWLSYRDESILGRPLTKEEARKVTSMARRISALILMSDELDANYLACRDTLWQPSPAPLPSDQLEALRVAESNLISAIPGKGPRVRRDPSIGVKAEGPAPA